MLEVCSEGWVMPTLHHCLQLKDLLYELYKYTSGAGVKNIVTKPDIEPAVPLFSVFPYINNYYVYFPLYPYFKKILTV